MDTISYYEHENEVYRMERANRRLAIALVIAVIALAVSKVIAYVER